MIVRAYVQALYFIVMLATRYSSVLFIAADVLEELL